MEDIFESVKNDIDDVNAIIEEYGVIKEEINKLFDTHILPLPEEYITPKG